ncbi:MAG: FAD-dependent oxidoreductase, partial [Alphaproteobacteria bacterium]|nr:FAD-dependent oxidoreductase [Alphaproteobacteria bacterium]
MTGVEQLERRFGESIRLLGGMPENWVPPTPGIDRDVVIVGAGQSGLAAAFGLLRAGVANIAIYDLAQPGREGPWVTTARMLTMRSHKGVRG